jgi:hypothetical protein
LWKRRSDVVSNHQAQGGVTFDLTELSNKLDHFNRYRRNVGYGVAVFWGLVSLVGVWLIIFGPMRADLWTQVGGIVAILSGILIDLVVWWYVRSLGRPFTSVTVTVDAITFGDRPAKRSWIARWGSPSFMLVIFDQTTMPPLEIDWTPRMFDYIAHSRGAPDTPLPRPAFEALMREVEAHGLNVTRKPYVASGPPGGEVVTISRKH